MKKSLAVILTLSICVGFYGFFIEPRTLRIRQETVTGKSLQKTIRLAFVSDIHIGAPGVNREKLDLIVSKINESNADLALFLGDFLINGVVGGAHVPASELVPSLKKLKVRYGKFAVLGNHDWWNDTDAIRRALVDSEIRVLENESARVDFGGDTVWLVGIGDDYTKHANPTKAFESVPTDALPIVITHDPAAYLDFEREAEVYLAGHTHGGQVYLPYFGALIIPGRSPLKYAYGWISKNGQRLRVTSGIGTSLLPVRFNMPPEVVILDIIKR